MLEFANGLTYSPDMLSRAIDNLFAQFRDQLRVLRILDGSAHEWTAIDRSMQDLVEMLAEVQDGLAFTLKKHTSRSESAEAEAERLRRAESERSRLESELRTEKELKSRAEHRVAMLEQDVIGKTALQVSSEKQLKELKMRLEQAKEEMDDLREQHRGEMESVRDDLRRELKVVRVDARKDVAAARADASDRSEEVAGLNAKLLACGERIHLQQKRLTLLEEERNNLEAKYNEAATTRDLFSQSLVRMRAEQDRLATELDMALDKYEASDAAKAKAVHDFETLQADFKLLEKEKQQLERYLLEAETEIKRKKNEAGVQTSHVQKLQEEIDRLKIDVMVKNVQVGHEYDNNHGEEEEDGGAGRGKGGLNKSSVVAMAKGIVSVPQLQRELVAAKLLAVELQNDLSDLQSKYASNIENLEHERDVMRVKYETSQREVRRLEQELGHDVTVGGTDSRPTTGHPKAPPSKIPLPKGGALGAYTRR